MAATRCATATSRYRELAGVADARATTRHHAAPVLTTSRPGAAGRMQAAGPWSGPGAPGGPADPDEPTAQTGRSSRSPTAGTTARTRSDDDPGPEADDEGGMSEYRYVLPEDYGRGQS